VRTTGGGERWARRAAESPPRSIDAWALSQKACRSSRPREARICPPWLPRGLGASGSRGLAREASSSGHGGVGGSPGGGREEEGTRIGRDPGRREWFRRSVRVAGALRRLGSRSFSGPLLPDVGAPGRHRRSHSGVGDPKKSSKTHPKEQSTSRPPGLRQPDSVIRHQSRLRFRRDPFTLSLSLPSLPSPLPLPGERVGARRKRWEPVCQELLATSSSTHLPHCASAHTRLVRTACQGTPQPRNSPAASCFPARAHAQGQQGGSGKPRQCTAPDSPRPQRRHPEGPPAHRRDQRPAHASMRSLGQCGRRP